MKQFFKNMIDKPQFIKRLVLCVLSCAMMGFCVSWLRFINLGTDPCSLMNFEIANKIGWDFGNWCALFNSLLFIIVLLRGREQVGFGTVINMFLVGYACDFMTWIRTSLLHIEEINVVAIRIIIMAVTLIIFVLVVAVYMAVELGTAPYDAIPLIIAKDVKKVPFKWVRIIWDVAATLIGIGIGGIFGGGFGIVTVIMAFAIGPVAAAVGKRVQKYIS